jgi:hypothetical protein
VRVGAKPQCPNLPGKFILQWKRCTLAAKSNFELPLLTDFLFRSIRPSAYLRGPGAGRMQGGSAKFSESGLVRWH